MPTLHRPRSPRRRVRATGLAMTGLAVLGGLTACGDGPSGGSGKTEIVASFYPMAWLAGKVAGPDGSVRTLTRPGTEPHDLELTARQIAEVGKADFTVYVKELQPAVDDAVAEHAKGKSLNAASVVKTLPPPSSGEEEHGGKATFDPHLWLDSTRLATVATALGGKLAAADPEHAAGYKSRAAATAAELAKFDQGFKTGLQTCQRKTIVTAHAAFGYLADRYGLQQVSIAGVDPAAEPSPRRLAELTQQVKAAKATTIFTETLVSPRVAEALARSAGVRTATLDPIEGIAPGSSDDYLSVMRKNLDTLKPALGCS